MNAGYAVLSFADRPTRVPATCRKPAQRLNNAGGDGSNSTMNIVLLGDRSFVGRGFAEKLEKDGHSCFLFGRGPVSRSGNVIRGPISELAENPHWPETADWIVNFILLKDRPIEENIEYCRRMLDLARKLKCKGIIHISSITTFAFDETVITERSRIDDHWADKPFYAGVKIATDDFLLKNANGLRVLFVRAGFVLGLGHDNVMAGTASGILGGYVLLLGNPKQFFPVTSRNSVQDSVLHILKKDDWPHGESFLIVDPKSPTKKEYIRVCCDQLGRGSHLMAMGRWFWYPAALAGEGLARLMGNKNPRVFSRIQLTFQGIRYDSTGTEAKLGMSLASDWRNQLAESYEGQTQNFAIPDVRELNGFDFRHTKKILFLGLGRIVFQKHLPAIRELGFTGSVDVFDPGLKQLPDMPFPSQRIDDPAKSDAEVAVIASPPAFHTPALKQLPSSVRLLLVEKPLAIRKSDIDAWATQPAGGGPRIGLFHNYRLKNNVLRFLDFIRSHHPGALLGARVVMDTGAIANDPSVWRRDEKASRTLLYDFGIHYLDLASLFGETYQGVSDVSFRKGFRGDTAEIRGTIRFSNYPVVFQIRQGQGMTRHQVHFDFANYSVRLTFHPDTFTALYGQDMILNRFYEFWNDVAFIGRYILSRFTHRDQDASHRRVYEQGLRLLRDGIGGPIALDKTQTTYRFLSDISKMVYGEE